jgi:hypothetical protein
MKQTSGRPPDDRHEWDAGDTGDAGRDTNDRPEDPGDRSEWSATEWAAIEDLLRRMPLRRPGPGLDARVYATLSHRSRDRVRRLRQACLGVAAVLAVAAGVAPLASHLFEARRDTKGDTRGQVTTAIERPTDPSPLSAPSARPARPAKPALPGLRVERTVARVTDEGIVGQLAGAPLQRYRRQSQQQVWWVDPRQGARLSASVPREEVVVVRMRPF